MDAECRFTARSRTTRDCSSRRPTPIIQRPEGGGQAGQARQLPAPYPHCWRCKSPSSTGPSPPGSSSMGRSRTGCWRPTRRSTGSRPTSRTAASASGWRGPATGRSAATATGATPSPSGSATGAGDGVHRLREELEERRAQPVTDLHKHFVDEITFPCGKWAGTMRRIPEVLDCWFESGAMPYGQNHYPFENKEHFESHFPADFICEGPGPDPGLVLHPHRPGGRPLRQARRSMNVRGQRPGAGRGRQEDVEVGPQLHRPGRRDRHLRGGRPAAVPDALRHGRQGRGPALLRRRGQGGAEERHHPVLERLQLLRHLRQHRRRPARRPARPRRTPWTAGSCPRRSA
jgi:hypothetical protein